MNYKSEKGVGLIEIIVAILIYGIGISAALKTLPVSSKATSRAQNITKATNLAQEKIEELMGSQFGSADLTAGSHSDPDNPIERIFTRTWTVTDDSPVAEMKSISVDVTYASGSKDNSVQLTTYLTPRR